MQPKFKSYPKPEYWAGLFDGEGSFRIKRTAGKNRGAPNRPWLYQCEAQLTLVQRGVIEQLQENFGGSIQVRQPRKPTHNVYHTWVVASGYAAAFADAVLPWLLIKHNHAQLLIDFQNAKDDWRNSGETRISPELDEFYEDCFMKMKELNKRGA